MKNTYIAIEIKENDKYLAQVLKVSPYDNLLSKLQIKGLVHANICDSKQAALKCANFWNECNLKNGEYYFENGILYPAIVR